MTPEERQQLQSLVEWKRQRETQQITFPLDSTSQEILSELFMHITSATVVGGVVTLYFGEQGSYKFEITPV